ncbi:hypothetical protein F4774DRAFT_370168 [Daldinia eschscholtzii]|nr:hypothetical protein F4774DRAFT_370168 [Daldinia eschscholtzii]
MSHPRWLQRPLQLQVLLAFSIPLPRLCIDIPPDPRPWLYQQVSSNTDMKSFNLGLLIPKLGLFLQFILFFANKLSRSFTIRFFLSQFALFRVLKSLLFTIF